MLRSARNSAIIGIVGAVVCTVALAGCSGDSGESGSVTLAETKSPVQLLRNDAAGRMPPAIIDEVEVVEDVSVACLDVEEDALGINRSWNSTAIVTIKEAAQSQIKSVVEDLIASYVGQGWKASERGGTLTAKTVLLRSDASVAEIEVSSLLPDLINEETAADDVDRFARIQIRVQGPCVDTDGADSDEVMNLEGR
ncbi:MAG: hypothetical protein ACOH1J_03855 [Microbacteriaceae bacterium]